MDDYGSKYSSIPLEVKRQQNLCDLVSIPPNGTGLEDRILPKEGIGIVVVDMQHYFLKHMESSAREKLIEAQIDVLKYAIEYDIPTFVLYYRGSGHTVKELKSYIRKIPRYRFIGKRHDDGFKNTALKQILDSYDVKTMFIMGINEDGCIMKTSIGGESEGFGVISSPYVIANDGLSGGTPVCFSNQLKERGKLFEDNKAAIFR